MKNLLAGVFFFTIASGRNLAHYLVPHTKLMFFIEIFFVFVLFSSSLFGGLVADVRSKARFYLSDFRDGFALQSAASIIFLYFATLTPVVAFGMMKSFLFHLCTFRYAHFLFEIHS